MHCFANKNKTGSQPVSRPVERVHYLGGWSGGSSLFDAMAVQTVTLLALCALYFLGLGFLTSPASFFLCSKFFLSE